MSPSVCLNTTYELQVEAAKFDCIIAPVRQEILYAFPVHLPSQFYGQSTIYHLKYNFTSHSDKFLNNSLIVATWAVIYIVMLNRFGAGLFGW
jgi:hypothetical protein